MLFIVIVVILIYIPYLLAVELTRRILTFFPDWKQHWAELLQRLILTFWYLLTPGIMIWNIWHLFALLFGCCDLRPLINKLSVINHKRSSSCIQDFIDYLDFTVYGVGLPGMVIVVVIVTTVVTTLRLRKAAAWRSESSSGTLSSREVALTKMLIGNSIFFIICVTPTTLFKYVCFRRRLFDKCRCCEVYPHHRCSQSSLCSSLLCPCSLRFVLFVFGSSSVQFCSIQLLQYAAREEKKSKK